MSCYPVEQRCKSGWIIKSEIGKGVFGTVSEACCKNNCNFVMKIQKYSVSKVDKILKITKENILKEKNIQEQAYQKGFAPEVHDYFEYNESSIIIMEAMKHTVKELFLLYNNKKILSDIFGRCLGLIIKSITKGISQNYPNLSNIMVTYDQVDYDYIKEEKIEDENDVYTEIDYKFKLIDYGLAEYVKDENESMKSNIQLFNTYFLEFIESLETKLMMIEKKEHKEKMINKIKILKELQDVSRPMSQEIFKT